MNKMSAVYTEIISNENYFEINILIKTHLFGCIHIGLA